MIGTALVAAADAADAAVALVSGAARRQRAGLAERGHRPFPLPEGPWVMGQTWEDLLFAHWPVAVEDVRARVPRGVEIDAYEGRAWLGITPFVLSGLRPRGLPPVPVVSRFPELNVRTYVTRDGIPGIWFFTLDTSNPLAVAGARAAYRLPYRRASMRAAREAGWVTYRSRRDRAELRARYRPSGRVFNARDGSLEAWFTERYRLYTVHRGRVLAADIHHPPWPLQAAEASIGVNTMSPGLDVDPAAPARLHFAARQDIVVWPPREA